MGRNSASLVIKGEARYHAPGERGKRGCRVDAGCKIRDAGCNGGTILSRAVRKRAKMVDHATTNEVLFARKIKRCSSTARFLQRRRTPSFHGKGVVGPKERLLFGVGVMGWHQRV